MRRRSDRAALWGVTGVLAAAAIGFALSARPPSRTRPGTAASGVQELFDAKCGACHAPQDLASQVRNADEPAEIRRHFERFLGSHGSANHEQVVSILDWIDALATSDDDDPSAPD